MIGANIFASHKEHDIIRQIPEYESQESLDSDGSIFSVKRQNCTLPFKDTPLVDDEKVVDIPGKNRVVLSIFVRSASKIVISDKKRTVWACSLPLDEKKTAYQKYEASFFKANSNTHDEYTVEVDSHLRKCIFTCGVTWDVFVDKSRFSYQRKIEKV